MACLIVGFDIRLDTEGQIHPWRMGALNTKTLLFSQVIAPLPSLQKPAQWLSLPRDPLYGDLRLLKGQPMSEQATLMATGLIRRGIAQLAAFDDAPQALLAQFELEGLELILFSRDNNIKRSLHLPIPGDAGTDISSLAQIIGNHEL